MASKKEDKNKKSAESATQEDPPPSWIIWGVRGVSLLIVFFLLGYFTWAAFKPQHRPVFEFEIIEKNIAQRGTGWVLPVEVTNTGNMSVHNAKVKATLSAAEGQPEESITLILVGADEQVTAEFWFNEDPRGKNPVFEVGSYLLP